MVTVRHVGGASVGRGQLWMGDGQVVGWTVCGYMEGLVRIVV